MTALPLAWSFTDPGAAGVWVIGLALLTEMLGLGRRRTQPSPQGEGGLR